ncbi:hypothetical protein FQA39_LY14887 [Lamprigera yunnana]|nr:hypothetical protein FQA39_LY14887 [Lamprigera yunnana]
MENRYGLIVPNKNKPLHPIGSVQPSIFGNDSDSDPEQSKPTGLKTSLKRHDRAMRQKAMEEDPTVFQYDELYDDMNAKRKESKLLRKDLDKKPKYINKLLQSAERRKRENERRIERQVQREREAEGSDFQDKDSFVTSSYRAKLEELHQLDEEEKREDYLESIGDVRKQGNLDGFYRHLYDQKILYEDDKEKNTKRKYRKRDSSSESETEPVLEPQLQHLPSNIDADSDFSIDSSDSEQESKPEKVEIEESENKTLDVKPELIVEEVKEPVKIETKPKIDIWKKRTVGQLFDEALYRYFERKSLRETGSYIRPTL